MGAWGTAILSDDAAADTRDTFRDFIGEGISPDEATERVIAESAEMLADEEEANVFWLALAATQWKIGRLVDSVRDQALEIIDSGVDLRRWQESSKADLNKRKKHLEKLREQLLSPQPERKKIKVYPKSSTDFLPGDIAVYRLDDQISVRFCVVGIQSNHGSVYADICLLGLDTPEPFDKTALLPTDTMGPHYEMLSREPTNRITILRRGVTLPERDSNTSIYSPTVSGMPLEWCNWKQFPDRLRDVLWKLRWF